MTVARVQRSRMTAEEYLQLGEDPPGQRLELVDGEVVVSPSAFPRHSHVISSLNFILLAHVRVKKLGSLFIDTDVSFDLFTVRRPDLCFYSTRNLHLVSETHLKPPPDLCVEVLSPHNAKDDRIDKFELYQKHGVAHYWIIDPDARTAECFELVEGKYQLMGKGNGSQIVQLAPFAELPIPLGELWMPRT